MPNSSYFFGDPRPVKKCQCFDKKFRDLKEAGIKSVDEAGVKFGCGTKCGLCRPYIERMLETGEVEFAVFVQDGNA